MGKQPTLSPDRTKLAFYQGESIVIGDTLGNILKKYSTGYISPQTQLNMAWSADAKHILFVGETWFSKLTIPVPHLYSLSIHDKGQIRFISEDIGNGFNIK